MDFEREIRGVKFEHPIMNAAGIESRTLEDVEKLLASNSSGVMVGSITCKKRNGNPGDTAYFDDPSFSINCRNLPNGGYYYYSMALPQMVLMARKAKKPIGVSIAGATPEEFVELAIFAEICGAEWVQLNLSCPNGKRGKNKGRIFCFDLELTRKIVANVMNEMEILVDVKLSPMSDPVQREEMAHLLEESGANIVTLCNTFPDVLAFGPDLKPVIRSKLPKGLITMGGYGGPALKPISLAHVALFRSILRPEQHIIGVGGIESGRDVVEYEQAGATLVQVGTARAVRGIKVFDQILAEYVGIRMK